MNAPAELDTGPRPKMQNPGRLFRGTARVEPTKPTIPSYIRHPLGASAKHAAIARRAYGSDTPQCKTALLREYRLICRMIRPIERAFWQLEQRKGQLADQLANEGVRPFCEPRREREPHAKGGT